MVELNDAINAIGMIRKELADMPQEKITREIALAVTKLDEAMLWIGVEAGKVVENPNIQPSGNGGNVPADLHGGMDGD